MVVGVEDFDEIAICSGHSGTGVRAKVWKGVTRFDVCPFASLRDGVVLFSAPYDCLSILSYLKLCWSTIEIEHQSCLDGEGPFFLGWHNWEFPAMPAYNCLRLSVAVSKR